MSAVLSLPCTARSRGAYRSLRCHVPGEMAARAVADLEHGDQEIRRAVLARIPGIPVYEWDAWLELHGYVESADRCAHCRAPLSPHRTCAWDPTTQRAFCVACANGGV